jgi:hypothetical protein
MTKKMTRKPSLGNTDSMPPSFASFVQYWGKKIIGRGASRVKPKGLVHTHKPKLNSGISRHPRASRVKQKRARQPQPVSFLPLLLYQNEKSTRKEHTRQFSILVFQVRQSDLHRRIAGKAFGPGGAVPGLERFWDLEKSGCTSVLMDSERLSESSRRKRPRRCFFPPRPRS